VLYGNFIFYDKMVKKKKIKIWEIVLPIWNYIFWWQSGEEKEKYNSGTRTFEFQFFFLYTFNVNLFFYKVLTGRRMKCKLLCSINVQPAQSPPNAKQFSFFLFHLL